MRSTGTLDDLDKSIIVALQQDGRATWTAIAEQCGTSGATVTRRGQQLINDGVVSITAVPGRGSDGPVESLLIWINCKEGGQLEVATRLVQRPDIRYISLIIGAADILAELVVPKASGRMAEAILDLQGTPQVDRVRADLILHVHKISHDWGRQVETLFHGELAAAPQELIECSPSHLDRQDRAMLELLRDDGRATFSTVAQELGLDASSVRRRFERLRGSGCLTVVTLVEAAALGLESETMITVRTEPKQLGAIATALARYREVRYLAVTLSGALVCEVIVPSTEALHTFITVTLAGLKGVLSWDAFMETLTIKRSSVETPWWRSKTRGGVTSLVPDRDGRRTGLLTMGQHTVNESD